MSALLGSLSQHSAQDDDSSTHNLPLAFCHHLFFLCHSLCLQNKQIHANSRSNTLRISLLCSGLFAGVHFLSFLDTAWLNSSGKNVEIDLSACLLIREPGVLLSSKLPLINLLLPRLGSILRYIQTLRVLLG